MFQTLLKRVEYDNARAAVISENLANLNTPNYCVMDLAPMSVRGKGRVALAITHGEHRRNASIGDAFQRIHDIESTRPDGHVSLNEQMVKLQETYAESTLMLNSFKKFVNFHKIILEGSA
jgi:flagellar basal body rod protein FlgB